MDVLTLHGLSLIRNLRSLRLPFSFPRHVQAWVWASLPALALLILPRNTHAAAQITPPSAAVEVSLANPVSDATATLSNIGSSALAWRLAGIRDVTGGTLPPTLAAGPLAPTRLSAPFRMELDFSTQEIIVGLKVGSTAQTRLKSRTTATPASSLALMGGRARFKKQLARVQHPFLKGRIRPRVQAGRDLALYTVEAKDKADLLQAVADLRKDPNVAYAEPNYRVRAIGIPNDPEFYRLYGLHNVGQGSGLVDADIDAPEAWDTHTGGEILVGVIDTGIDYLHPDLVDNMWTNPGEIPGNGLDDDGNGYVDDVHGYDFVNDDGDPMDDHYHGTHVAGTIAAAADNGIGIAGVAPNAKLVALKFLSSSGFGNLSDAIDAIAYANAMGIPITNNSWGGGGFSQALKDAIDAAGAAGYLFVAAAGNNGFNMDQRPDYPAGYESANILSVAATDAKDQIAWFSNYGATTVDLGAPGVDVYSCGLNGNYQYLSGTSMASPHVAGAAALLWTYNPQMTGEQIKAAILEGVDTVSSLLGRTLSGGRLNLNNSLAKLPAPWVSVTPKGPDTLLAGQSRLLTARFDASRLVAGEHRALARITTDDPAQPELNWELRAHVQGCRALALTASDLNLGLVWVGQTGTGKIKLTNACNDTTTITAITGLMQGFDLQTPLPAKVPPFGGLELIFAYSPSETGETQITVSLQSNAANAPQLELVLRGRAVPPPTLSVSPSGISATLDADATETRSLTLRNDGGDRLVVKLRSQITLMNEASGKKVAAVVANSEPRLIPGEKVRGEAYAKATFNARPGDLKPAFKALSSGLKVLYLTTILPSGGEDDFVRGLRGLPNVGSLDVVDGSNQTPNLDYLLTYDAVIVSSNSPWSNPVALGNVLADYADAGGGLALMVASIASGSGYGLGGRIAMADYMPIEMAGAGRGGEVRTFESHPINEGVAYLACYLPTAARRVQGGAQALGTYASGDLLGAVHADKPIVAINVFPSSGYWSGDLIRMMGNSLDHVSGGGGWLRVEPRQLVLEAGAEASVQVTLNASGLVAGAHTGFIRMEHNAPDSPNPLEVPAQIEVRGIRRLAVTPNKHDFGAVFVGGQAQASFTLVNAGNQDTHIQTIQAHPAFLILTPLPLTVPAFKQAILEVAFRPRVVANDFSSMQIDSDAEDHARLLVTLRGQGLAAPVAHLAPSLLSVDLNPNDAPREFTVVLGNNGGNNLTWSHAGIREQKNVASSARKLTSYDLARIDAALSQGHAFKLDQVIVGFKEGYSEFAASQSLSVLSAKVVRHLAPARKPGMPSYRGITRQPVLISLPTQTREGVLKAVAAMRQDANVAYAEPNYIYRTSLVPNDPEYARLYGLHNVGQSGGNADADIDAPEAWDQHTGGDATVGIIDTGIDYLHPDLAENIWINFGEIPGNGLDDDGNGYADDVHGYDFVNDDADPMDDHFHGTHVAGTIAAVGNNGLGVVGVCWKAKVAALKFLDAGGSGSLDDAVDAVAYATAMGMPITSNSWGGGGYSQALKDAIDAAGAAGSLFVAAAGNSGSDLDIFPDYPAGYDSPNILSVAATDASDAMAFFSNYGLTSVDLGAPGVDVYSTLLNGDYGYLSGTSMATPHVSGAAALLLSYNTQATLDQIKTALLGGVDAVPDLNGRTLTGGRLNVQKALAAMSPPWISITPRGAGEVEPRASQSFTVRIDPKHLIAGSHQAQIAFATNDPLRPTMTLEVSAMVSGCRSLALAQTSLDFGTVWIGKTAMKAVQLSNACNDTTTIHQIDGLGSVFSVSTALPLKVPPFGTAILELAYAPASTGKTKATLIVRSNAQTPALNLSVQGSGVKPPTLENNPTSFSVTMDPGQTLTKTLTVRNRGGANLEVQFRAMVPNSGASAIGPISRQASGASVARGNLVRGLPRSGANYAQGHGLPKSLKPNAHGRPEALAENLNILYLTTVYTDSSSYFLSGLRTLPQVARVDVLDGMYYTPDAAYLAAYDQVIVSASGFWSDAVGTGNALADYVDGGGRVTLMTAAIADEGGWSLGGRITSPDFMPIEMAGPGEYGYVSTFDSHPITEGMTYLECYLPTAAQSAAGEGASLGAYQNGQIIGAYHQSKPIVALNVYPEDGYWGGDLLVMLGNTLNYLDQFKTWFKAEPASLVVQPGKSVDVKVTFNSKGLLPGAYAGDLAMLHNVPGKANPSLIPVSLQVKAKRCLSAVASIDFGKVWIGGKADRVLELENACNEAVTLQQFVLAPSWFQSSLTVPVQIQPFSKMTVSLSYRPTNLLPGLGLLVVKSNAQNSPLLQVVLKGQAVRPPAVSVSPGALQVTADPGLLVTREIKVSNAGGDTLRLQAAVQAVENGLLPPPIPNPSRPKQPPQCKPGKPRLNMNLHTYLAHQKPNGVARGEPRLRPAKQSLHPAFQPLAGSLKVLYFHTLNLDSLSDDPFVTALRALPNVGTLDLLDGRYQTPNVEYLQQYDIVVVSQDWSFADPVGAGDVLADYVDQGGRTVLLGMTFTPLEGFSLAGRIMQPEYLPLQRQFSSWDNRDAVLESHPINTGVASLEAYLANASDSLAPQGMPLGRYSNGHLTGAYHKSKPVVALNFFPLNGYWSGDVPRLMGNTFDYLASFIGWLFPESYTLAVPPGRTLPLKLVFDTRKTPANTYLAQLALQHNAPASVSPLHLPVTLKVQAKSCLNASMTSLDFGKAWLGVKVSREIVLTNPCNEATTVHSAPASSSRFAFESSLPLVVPAFSSMPVSIQYLPDDLKPDQGWVELRSNATNAPNLRVNLKGSAIQPPAISATPTHFSESLQPGESVTRVVRIGNTGGDTLDVSVKVVVQSAEADPAPDSGRDSTGTGAASVGPRLIPGKGSFGPGLVSAVFRTPAIDTTLPDTTPPDTGAPIPGVGKRILYVHTLYLDTLWDPIVWAMRYAPGVASVDLLDAQYVTPNAAYLSQYDLVAVASDYPWADNIALGNALADYVDEGGRVLMMMAALVDEPGIGIEGRFAGPEYLPMAKGSFAQYDYAYSFVANPITRNVSFASTYYHAYSSTLQGDGQPLGWYEGGALVGAFQENLPVVALNFLPAYYAWFGDFPQMVSNSVEYLLSESKVARAKPMRLRVPPGQTSELTLVFGDAQVEAGDYSVRFDLRHNAPAEPNPLSITADVHVEGLKKLVVSPAESDLGEVVVGQSAFGYWSLENQGNAPVTVTSVSMDSPDLFGDWPETPFTLAPQQILSGYLAFTPQNPGSWNASVRFESDGGNAELRLQGLALAPGELALTTAPDPLHFILPRGGASKGTLSLANVGDDMLYFNLRLNTQPDSSQSDSGKGPDTLARKAAAFTPEAFRTLAKGAADIRPGQAVTQTVGGPDRFGHRWIDSRDSVGPQFVWQEIAAPGNLLRTVSGCDDCSEAVNLTFDFDFYGQKHGTVYVNANGYLTMVKPSTSYSHTPLPSTQAPEALIAPFFRDLYPAGGGAIYARDFGDSLVVTWKEVLDFENTGRYTFQVVLRRNGSISYAYQSMQGVTDKATVGMQNFSRDDGLTLVFNGSFIADSLSVHTSTWVSLATEWGYIPGRSAVTAELSLDALATPEGLYSGTIEVYSGSSASGPERQTLPVTLEVIAPAQTGEPE